MKSQVRAEHVRITEEAFSEQSEGVKVYWLGGGAALINARGKVILIDLVLTDMGRPLLIPHPLTCDEVKRADLVLITHCDYDHFSESTLLSIQDRVGEFHSTHYVSELCGKIGIRAQGHDINETFTYENIEVTLTPADHNWQNEKEIYAKERYYAKEDYCGFYIRAAGMKIWMPGDSRLMEEQLKLEEPDVILLDFSESRWHIGLAGAKRLTDTYPHATLIPIHWGCVDAPERGEFAGDPDELRKIVNDPERLHVLPSGGHLEFE